MNRNRPINRCVGLNAARVATSGSSGGDEQADVNLPIQRTPRNDDCYSVGIAVLEGNLKRMLTADELMEIVSGRLWLWVITRAEYRHVFHGPGETEACSVYDPSLMGLVGCDLGQILK